MHHHSKKRKKKKHNDGLLFLLTKNDLFDPRDNFNFAEREGTGSNYIGDNANWVMICCFVEKCALINQSVSSRPFVEDSYGASFQGRNSSQFRRSSTNITEKPGNLFDSF